MLVILMCVAVFVTQPREAGAGCKQWCFEMMMVACILLLQPAAWRCVSYRAVGGIAAYSDMLLHALLPVLLHLN
jgi:hypothetical protein